MVASSKPDGPIDAERLARMQLGRAVEPGDPTAARLVRRLSGVTVVEGLRRRDLQHPRAVAWAARLAVVDLDGMLAAMARTGARFVIPGDDEWPVELAGLQALEDESADRPASEPIGLWLRGPLDLARASAVGVAIVGARASTEYGDHVAGDLAAGCAARGRVVVSGGAYGIDAAAHRGALAADGPTLAVLASGIDRSYPTGHVDLLQQVASTGLLVSEAAPGCAPSRSRFLVRNRLIAALSQGTVVVEAALRSGSLNTARWARDIGRPVMGVPGPVTSTLSAGVHELLRQPESVLVTDAAEVLELVSPIGTASAPPKQGDVRERDGLSEPDRRLLDAVPKVAPAPAASIATYADVAPAVALARLADLTRRGLVVRVGGGWRLPPDAPDAP